MSELIKADYPQAGGISGAIAVIARAAADPAIDVDKMERLLNVQIKLLEKQAEIDFTNDLSALQEKMPRITKDKKIKHRDTIISNYASYEHIDKHIRPLLAEHGFSLRFNTAESSGKIIITGTLSHRGGHSITDAIPLAIDSGGAKNAVQAVGSTITYGKRYLVGMLLNLVFEGEDDDGAAATRTPINDAQAEEIKSLLEETGADVAKFLAWAKASCVDEMDAAKYEQAVSMLRRRGKA